MCLEIFILFQSVPWLKKSLRTGSRAGVPVVHITSLEGGDFSVSTETLVSEVAHSAVAILTLMAGLYLIIKPFHL